MQAEIRENLIDRLIPIFGHPRDANGLAAELVRYAPEWATAVDLAKLADRIIATRKSKGFPSASELIAAIKILPRPQVIRGSLADKAFEIEKAREAAHAAALNLLRGGELARRAVDEKWAPALIDFTVANGREPDLREERALIAKSRANDVDVRDLGGTIGRHLQAMRDAMHEAATRRLLAQS